MKIGELARLTSTSVETLRFYEREGLLPQPARTAANYRVYGADHASRVAFIRHCRTLDMALEEIRALLQFRESPQENCAGVNDLLDAHISQVVRRIAELRELERQLRALRHQCTDAGAAHGCGILKELADGAVAMPAGGRGQTKNRGAH